ncbi:putative serine/threonine-protein kinase iks1 [Mortierella polycephala]|uniref:non-specific serine/threonine protein kinase n=1 Tax=Mortierella polycephala TaxID=41804 RepID=A0A9P6QEI3_9FUNG|nr:putative serine/threonine-protein kinase iks1 [Mortierella polycephala]
MNDEQNQQNKDTDSKKENKQSHSNSTSSTTKQLHPLHAQHQQQPWLIPHPNLPISWHNNDRATRHPHHVYNDSYDSYAGPSSSTSQSSSLQRFNSTLRQRPTAADTKHGGDNGGVDWRAFNSSDRELHQYRENVSDQGHESDPSELMRAPVLFGTSPTNDIDPSVFDRQGQDLFPFRRTTRSMSLSMSPDMYDDGLSLPSSTRNHGEVVPYSQEWRVILRSSSQGRTVLYNPQMQSLVIQTTVGPDSHPVSFGNDSQICALCRRPLGMDDRTEGQDGASGTSTFMDTNYFRMLADANIALSRRGSIQLDQGLRFQATSPLGSPASSSRASLELDSNQTSQQDDSRGNAQDHTPTPHLSHDALNQGYYERFFVEQVKLGRGYRGSVFLCQHILDGIHLGEYAIKKVAVGDNHDWLVQMLREVHLLERLHHPNIVSYKHAWLENHQLHKFGPEVTCLFILMECANGGNLEEYIERPAELQLPTDEGQVGGAGTKGSNRESETKKPLSAKERLLNKRHQLQGSLQSSARKTGESSDATERNSASQQHYLSITEIWSFFFDVCEGLAHLHRLGIIHRDLKPPNLLLSYSNSQVKGSKGERPRILITDFGECEILEQVAKRDRTGATGTLEFLAPELLATDVTGRYTDEFSFKGDMWSLGMVLYYLCYSRLPYSQIEDVDILKEEIKGFKSISIPEDEPGGRVIPDELKYLIRILLSTDKSKRPSCDDILSSLSYQRDRMMHGDMDSPTTPIKTSSISDLGASAADIVQDGDIPEPQTTTQDESQQSTSSPRHAAAAVSRDSQGLHAQRQQYFGPTALSGRRRSRASLTTESPKRAPGQHSSSVSPTLSRNNTTSPSATLHKKVKPLGLGLRHMLRRKMMHPVAVGVGIQRYVRNDHAPREQPNVSENLLQVSFPTAMSSSLTTIPWRASSESIDASSAPSSGPFVGQRQEDMHRQQQFQARKRAASERESSLGLDGQESPTVYETGKGKTRHGQGRSSVRGAATTPSASKQRRSRNGRDRQAGSASRRASMQSDMSDSSSDSNLEVKKPQVIGSSRGAGAKGKVISKVHNNHRENYWANLASTHAQEKPRVALEPKHTESDSAADDTSSSTSSAANASPERNSQHGSGGRHTQPPSSHKLSHPHPLHSKSSGKRKPPLLQFLPEQVSVHFLFLSLVLRVWFCLSICNPIMIRPLVLYPVLVMTIAWDRYLLSLISDRYRSVFIMPPRNMHRKIEGSSKDQATDENSLSGATAEMSSAVTSTATHDDNQLLRHRSASGMVTTATDAGDAGESALDLDSDRQGQDLVTRQQLRSDDVEAHVQQRDTILFWQAFILGIAIQLLWIGAVWLFSRNGVCVM